MTKNYVHQGAHAENKALALFSQTMIERLETIQSSEWKKPWFTDDMSHWPVNLSGRKYSASNAAFLMMVMDKNGYELPVWTTFSKFSLLNYTDDAIAKKNNGEEMPRVMVKKGEKSTPVFLTYYTVFNKDTKEQIPFSDYRELDDKKKKMYNVYERQNVFYVFNVCQTNLKETRPELYEKLMKDYGSVKCEEREVDESLYEPFNSMANEQHSTEELVAELGAALTCKWFGATKRISGDLLPYTKIWIDNLKQDTRFIKNVMNDVKKAFSVMTDRVKATDTSYVA